MAGALGGRNFEFVGCSAKTGDGLQEGMEWLVETLNESAKNKA